MPEILTDEQAAAIWSGQTTSLLGLDTSSTKTAEELAAEAAAAKQKQDAIDAAKVASDAAAEAAKTATKTDPTKKVKDEDLDKVFGGGTDDPDDDTDENEPSGTTAQTSTIDSAAKKAGRKTDLVQAINQLISEDVLFGYEDGKGGLVEIKTLDEAKQLIKDNLTNREKDSEEAWKKDYRESFSPQVQAILQYAEQGAQSASQIAELIGAIRDVEEVGELDIKTPAGQEQVVRQTLKAKGFKDTYIDKQVNILKDLGADKMKEEAEELYPELAQMKSEQVRDRMAQQDKRRKEAEDASRVYVTTVKSTLDKELVGGIKLTREDKAKLFEAVTQPKYVSLNGAATNLFVKTLEDLQFGKNADYEQFMNIVQYTVDPKGFLEKLKTTVGNDLAESTFRKLKTSKTTTQNTNQDDNTTRVPTTSKKTIPKSGFRNPYE